MHKFVLNSYKSVATYIEQLIRFQEICFWSEELTPCGISQLSACNSCIILIPFIVTDSAPSTINTNLHSALKVVHFINKSDISVVTAFSP